MARRKRDKEPEKKTDKENLIEVAFNLPVGKTRDELAEMPTEQINGLIDARL